MSSALFGAIPFKKPEDCGEEIEINCDEPIEDSGPSDDYDVVLPVGNGSKLPTAGGAIVKMDFSNLPTSVPDDTLSLLIKKTEKFRDTYDANIEGLTQARVALNNIISDVGKSRALKSNPKLYISTSTGDNSSLDPNIASASVIKICEMKFIPVEILEAIGEEFLLAEDSKTFGSSDNPIYGASGYKFTDFGNLSDDDLVIGAMIDLVPFYNISESEITKKRGGPSLGGYYTVVDNNAFIKMPDLTGRDSAGFDPDLFSEDEERHLYFEILNGARLTRVEVTSIDPAPAAVVADYDQEFPDEGSLEIELDTTSDISEAYLSLIVETDKPKVRGIRVFDNGIELSTIPMLTKPVTSKIGLPTGVFSYTEDDAPGDILAQYIDQDADVLSFDLFAGDYGKLTVDGDNIGLEYELGEQNRPEILLANRNKDKSNKRNNRKYTSTKIPNAREIFAEMRPKLYEKVPASWVKGTISSGEVTTVSFSASDMKKIKRTATSSTYNFALYIGKGEQIVRVPGPNILLGPAAPEIESISPHGFIGSSPIEADTQIRISGDQLKDVIEVQFVSEGGSSTLLFNTFSAFPVEAFPESSLSATSSVVIIKLGDAYANLAQGVQYDVSVRSSNGTSSNSLPIYIGTKDTAPPYPGTIIATFEGNEFSAADFSENAEGIPLLSDGQSASIKIRSKSKLFSGKYPLFAYLAVDFTNSDVMADFELANNIKRFTTDSFDIAVAPSIQFEFSESLIDDFYKLSKRKAILKFPGSGYTGFNFSRLPELDKAYFLFTNDSMKNLVGDETIIDLIPAQYSLMTLGGNEDDEEVSAPPAFIQPGSITGVVAEIPGGNIVSLTADLTTDEEILEIFGQTPDIGNISVFTSVPRMAITFSGTDMPFMRKRHDFKLGTEDIKTKLTEPVRVRSNGRENIAVFRNVNTTQEGFLGLGVEVNDKRFKVKYDSSTAYGTVTSYVPGDEFSLDEEDQVITTNTSISSTQSITSAIIGPIDTEVPIVNNLINAKGEGLIVSEPSNLASLTPYNPISITSRQGDITLKLASVGDTEASSSKIIANTSEDEVKLIDRQNLEIPTGSIYQGGQYLTDSDATEALIFNRIAISEPVSIGFSLPEIIGMATTKAALSSESIPTSIPMVAGDRIHVRVKNVKKNFSMKVGTAVVKAVSVTKVPGRKNVYDAQFVVPGSLIGLITGDDCQIICASGTNAGRLRAKGMLGTGFVTDLEERMKALLFGALEKIPDIEELKEILCNFPLRFPGNIDICDISIPTELINKFCDLSFHLLADLKIALNGFQVLMIPIQVIFCIIDVLCSLLNPIKTAKAMIRLFECLFDLVLLLPQISIPVMFIKLILHLLELLECVINKILGTITAINEIVGAIKLVIEAKDWPAVKALEEVLSEYLFTLNVDLDILAPVISILAIFLQLLQLVFRFPCQVTPSDAAGDCVIDGSMLAGIVGGVVAPEEVMTGDHLLPVAQVYTQTSLTAAATNGGSTIETPASGNVVAIQEDGTYFDSMELDEETLRATNNDLDFKVSMAVSVTKSKKKGKKANGVEFQFKSKYDPSYFIPSKILDPDGSGDSPLQLLSEDNNGQLTVASGKGNFISPQDGKKFITKSGEYGSVKTLTEDIEVPIYEADPTTGLPVITGTETASKTFDSIPMMTILDEAFNLYFIEKDGIEFDDDDNIVSIRAKMVNQPAADKLRFSRESEDVDLNADDVIDDSDTDAKVYTFPQIYFVDMRACLDDINAFCNGASLNSFLLDEDNTDDIADIVEEAQDCLEAFRSVILGFGAKIRESLGNGEVPEPISLEEFQEAQETLRECLEKTVDDMCFYAVNTLNSSFRVLEDEDFTPNPKYEVPSLDEEALEGTGYEENPPDITGATEYAEGEGDQASIGLGEKATIVVTPRDAQDIALGGDLTEKIILEIVSDSTGSAEIVKNEDESIFTRNGNDYYAYVTANDEGIVRLRAKVCSRTIQAVTYAIEEEDETTTDVDCIPSTGEEDEDAVLGALIKVDRIVTLFFARKSTAQVSDGDDQALLAQTNPQTFGTSLEN
jgi:hypothetical protein